MSKVIGRNKYIEIVEVPEPRHEDSETHLIFNKSENDLIGHFEYYKPWRQHVFVSNDSIVWNDACLSLVISCLKSLKK